MKLELEFTHVDHAAKRVTLKPINCALKGELIYNLPNRAAEMCKVGDVVEASIPLPDQYPVCELPEKRTNCGDWQEPIRTAPTDGTFVFLRMPDRPDVYAKWDRNHRCWLDERGNAVVCTGEPIYWKYPLDEKLPFDHKYPCYDPCALETKLMDRKWYKHSPDYPHNWEPIQAEIDKAMQQARRDGQPHVIAGCGYVSNDLEFIPYKRVGECVA